MQSDRSLRFHPLDNDQIIAYSKITGAAANVILTIVNLDPLYRQSGWIRCPARLFSPGSRQPYEVQDLLTGARFRWQGSRNYVELDPAKVPAHILRVNRAVAADERAPRSRLMPRAFAEERSHSCPTTPPPQWYKDAIIYQLHVRTFSTAMATASAIFPGFTQKLDYLQDLGINAIWLLPFFPSPLRDDGYDIADYTSVHPQLRRPSRTSRPFLQRPTNAASASSSSWF